jgi:hypothetical protein
MRKTFLPVVAFLVSACAHNASQEGQPVAAQTPGAGPTVTASSIQVRTSTNGLLGYGLAVNKNSITMLTTTGWIVDISYDGTLRKNVGTDLRYSNNGCTGSVYIEITGPVYGQSLFYDGTSYYKPASSPAPQNSISVTYNSRKNPTCNDSSGTADVIPLAASTGPTEAGLPATITGPIILQAP